jgi:CubicO group peptidase (beta-lactamase class C family)
MNTTRLLLLFLLAVITFACSQQDTINKSHLPEASAEEIGISAESLFQIDTLLENAVANGNLPGIVALVAREGQTIYYKAFGMADNGTGHPLERDDIFRIASQSKAVTATAVMMLWEEGLFGLDDPVSKFIPEFGNAGILDGFNPDDTTYSTIPAERPVTIRHLLTHTSGVGYGMIDKDDRMMMIHIKAGVADLFTGSSASTAEFVKKLGSLPLHHNPGEKYTYSMGQDVLGYLIEVISGVPFNEFLRTRLFDPLGMEDTWFILPENLHERLVTVQHKENGKWESFPVTFYDPEYPKIQERDFFSGGAGLSSTAMDYAIFLQMYLNGGEWNGVRILQQSTIDTIMANHFPKIWDDTQDEHYGLVFKVLTGNSEWGRQGTFRWGGYFNTQYFADPEKQIIGILMKQTQGRVNNDPWKEYRELVVNCPLD